MKVVVLLLLTVISKSFKPEVFTIYSGDQVKYYDENLNLLDIKTIRNSLHGLERFHHITIDQTTYFLGQKSGEVFYLEGDSIIRADKTIDHRMTINASTFAHNDTIFKYGGYGYWSQRNFMTFFDKNSKEWEVYNQNKSYLPKGNYNGLVFKKNEKVYFFGGDVVNEKNRLLSIESDEVVFFDFTTKEYSNLGKLNSKLNDYNLIFNSSEFMILMGNWTIVKITPSKNLVEVFEVPPVLNNIQKQYADQNRLIGDEIYFIVKNAYEEVTPVKISTKELFSKPRASKKLYQKIIRKEEVGFGLLSSIIIILLSYLFYIKKRAFSRLTTTGIYHKNIFHSLNPKQAEVLFQLKSKGRLSTSEILSIIENKNLTYVHNIRLKNEFIEKLDYKLRLIFQLTNPSLYLDKGTDDKRVKYLQPSEAFKKVLERIKANKS